MEFLQAPPGPDCRPACIIAQGLIDAAAVRQFAQFVRADHVRTGATLVLDSLGGRHLTAIGFGEAIRQYGFATEVGRYDPVANRLGPGTCASACIYAFMGGLGRSVVPGSRVGVHQVRLGDAASTLSASDAQLLMALAAEHLAQWGAANELVTLALATPPDEIRWLTRAELVRFRVVTVAPELTGADAVQLDIGARPGLEATIRFRLLGVRIPEADPRLAGSSEGGG